VGQPGAFWSPVKLFGLPDIFAATAETESLETHRLEGNIASQNHEVGPGDLPSVLLLDRPQQPPCLVEVHIVRPAIERSEALLAASRPAAAVADAIRAGAVPRHANEQRPVVAKVRRPPVLRVGHKDLKILLQRL